MTIAAANNDDQSTSDLVRDALEITCQQVEEAEKDRLQGIITKTGQLTELPAWLRATGLEFELLCPICKQQAIINPGDDFFLAPEIGTWWKETITCSNSHTFHVEFKLDLQVTMKAKC